jgi:hypothetical protein
MTSAAPAARPEPHVDEWRARQETPSLLSFTNREKPSPEEISELLTRKFREFFP